VSAPNSIFPAHCEWPQAIDDVRKAPLDAAAIRLIARARFLEELQSRGGLKALWCFDVDTEALHKICECSSLESLYIDGIVTNDLGVLRKLRGLKILRLEACTRVTSFDDLGQLVSLRGLALTHFANVHDLGPLSGLRQLTALAVSGSMWTRMRVASFAPLASLKQLELLHLTNIKAEDESLTPLGTLTGLKHLDLANFYPSKEFAVLSQNLKSTECSWFKPFTEVGFAKCERCGGKKAMLTGKRKPIICPRCQRDKFERHLREWTEAIRHAA